MRDIKFRGYDKESQKIYQITDINFSDYSANGVSFGDWKEFGINNLLQYTGLKDKNGVEIYEGDICRCYGGIQEFGQYEYSGIYEVKYTGNGFDMVKNNCGYGWGLSGAIDVIEVIGNIYENPELLKNED